MYMTREMDYAIRIISNLSQQKKDKKISSRVLAKSEVIPKHFILKILSKLRQGELVESFLGSNGGYILKAKPKDISLIDVIEAIDGPLEPRKCPLEIKTCGSYPSGCKINKELTSIEEKFFDELDSINFENLYE